MEGGILGLQRGAGNQAVSNLLSAQNGSSGRNGAAPFIQTKLTVSHPRDKFEREADHVADQVMRMPEGAATGGESGISSNTSPVIHRACAKCEDELMRECADETPGCQEPDDLVQTKGSNGSRPEVTADLESRINSLQNGGATLPPSLRSGMESRFGRDFSQVRIHTGTVASETTQAVKARAFTRGSNIAFAPGQYSPGTDSGKRLLAHELTHVVQQGGAAPARTGNGNTSGGNSPGKTGPVSRITASTVSRNTVQRGVASGCWVPALNNNRIGELIHNYLGGLCAAGYSGCTWNTGITSLRRKKGKSRRSSTRPDLLRVQGNVAELGEIKPMSWRSGSKRSSISSDLTNKIAQYKRTNPTMTATRMTSVAFPPTTPFFLDPRQDLVVLGPLAGLYFYKCVKKGTGQKKKKKKKSKKKQGKTKTKSKPKAKPKAKPKVKAPRPKPKPKVKVKPKVKLKPKLKVPKKALTAKAAKKLRDRVIKRAVKQSAKALIKGGAKMAARLASRAIPVVGWILTAIDIAEAVYMISKYGIHFGGGEGGPAEEGAEGGAAGEGQAEGAEGGGGEGQASEGTTEESGTGEGGTEGGTGGEGGAGEGEREGQAEGEESAEAEGKGTEEGTGTGKGTGKGKGKAKGESTTEREDEGDEKGEDLPDIFTQEEIDEIVESLPLSDELIEALKKSTPEQQQLLDLMLTRTKEPGAPQVNEDFFKKVLEMSKDLTAEDMDRLREMTRPAQGESLDDILKGLKKAIESARAGKTGAAGEGKASEGKKPAGESTTTDKPKPTGESESSGEPKSGDGGGKKKGGGAKKPTEGGGGGKEKGRSGPQFTTPRVWEGSVEGTFNFSFVSGLPTAPSGALNISAGQKHDVTIRFNSGGKTQFTVMEFKVKGPVGDTTQPGTRITLVSTNPKPMDVAPEGSPPFIIKVENELIIEVTGG